MKNEYRCRKKDRLVLEHTFLISSCNDKGIAHCVYCGARWDIANLTDLIIAHHNMVPLHPL